MAKLVKAINQFDINSDYTYLSSALAQGGSVVNWDNPSGFSASWAIQIGKTAEEKTEILVLGTATPAQGAGTVTGTALYPHAQDTPIYAIYYDKLVFKRASGTSGTATPLTGGTVNITPDSKYTTFYDSSGADSYYYKVAPYNSVLGVEGVESDWLSASGYNFYALKRIRDRAKNKCHNPNLVKDDTVWNEWVNEWMEIMNNSAVDVNRDYSTAEGTIAFGTAGIGTITDGSYKDVRKIEVTFDGVNYGTATRMDIIDFDRSTSYSQTMPHFYFIDDDVFGIKPDNIAGTAVIHYYDGISPLSNDTDELPIVMRPYTKSFVDYCTAQHAYLDNDLNRGDRFKAYADADMNKFIKEIGPRHKTGTKMVKMDAPIDGDDSFGSWVF